MYPETWLNDSITDDMINIPNYTVVRQDRNCKRRGGGVCIYISNKFG